MFEEGGFVPSGKLQAEKQLSIVTNYLGTPEAMYSNNGEKTWSCQLDSYGKVRIFEGEWKVDCPFRYQGQYEDNETGLYYNRFRYYDPESGNYISQDPIGLESGQPNFYAYVEDPNIWVDVFGLECGRPNQIHHYATNKSKRWTGRMKAMHVNTDWI